MKKVALALALVTLLSACRAAPIEVPTAEQAAQAVVVGQRDADDYTSLTGEMLEGHLTRACGLEGLWEVGAAWKAAGTDPREVVVVSVAEEADVETAILALGDYLTARKADFFGYDPEGYALLEEALLLTRGNMAALLICTDAAAASEAFGQAEVQAVAPQPPMDMGGFTPFDPPNEVDMQLYDSAAVLGAWARKDPTGLEAEDARLYAAAQAALESSLTEGMTDFEKELALHDYLVTHGRYDDQSRDNAAHLGRYRNNDPYGMLVEGYGICLGYATAFQLLMDMAGVECITVVGASADSTSDHAWNMVRLDGEWYCVDPTWNDSMQNPQERTARERAGAYHQYFNVTSQRMRDTNHQWEYEAVPEATAQRFSWDGQSPLPT